MSNNEGESKPRPKLRVSSAFNPHGATSIESQPFKPEGVQAPARKPLNKPKTTTEFIPTAGPTIPENKLPQPTAMFTPMMPMANPQMMGPMVMSGMPMQMAYGAPYFSQMFMTPTPMLPGFNNSMPMQAPLLMQTGQQLPLPVHSVISAGLPTPTLPTPVNIPQVSTQPTGTGTSAKELTTTFKERYTGKYISAGKAQPAPFEPNTPKPEEQPPAEVVQTPAPVVPEPEPEKPEPEPAAKDDDDDDEEVEVDVEDYSKYSQEKPAKMIYPRDWIKEFLLKEKNIVNAKFDSQFEELVRDIESVPKVMSKSNHYSGSNRGGGGGYKPRGSDRPSRPYDTYSHKKDSRPNKYSKEDQYQPSYSGAVVVRPVATAEAKKRLEDLTSDSTNLVQKASQDDEEKATHKNINFSLNQLASENFNHCLETLTGYLIKSPQLCEKVVGMLIDKAWTQTTYTELFSKLLAKLGESKMDWFTNISKEREQEIIKQYREKEPVKIFKNIIVSKVRKEFNEGFEKLQNIMHAAEDNKEFNDERKTIEYNKSRDKFLANMSFIAQLYKLKYLPHKVMRTIAFQICDKFMLDLCNPDFAKYHYKTCDVFLMAFFRLMQVAGTTMEKKEVAEKEKEVTQPREKWEENQRKKSKAFVDVMMKCVKDGEYDQSMVISKFGDADKKEVNFINVVFDFIDALAKSGKITLLLKSFCITALEERRGGWKPTAPAPAPAATKDRDDDRKGGRRDDYKDSKNRGDDLEYEVKPSAPAAVATPAKVNLELDIEDMFKKFKTCDKIDEYKEAFDTLEDQFQGATAAEIFSVFLKFFLKHGNRAIFELRAQLTSYIVTKFKLEEAGFWVCVAKFLAKVCNEDIPARTKAMGLVINEALLNAKFDIKNMEPVLDSDPDEKENQLYFYQDVIDESIKNLTENSKSPEVIDSLKAYKQSKLKI